MKKISRTKYITTTGFIAAICILAGATNSNAQQQRAPALIVTNQDVPSGIRNNVYSTPKRTVTIHKNQITGESYFQPAQTIVGKKIDDLRSELYSIHSDTSTLSHSLTEREQDGRDAAASYFADVATINTQLQSGTTPGNPRLVQKMAQAQGGLESLARNVAQLNELAIEIANIASISNFLLETVRATYGLSGAIEEDHAKLALLEDSINNTIVIIDRLQNNVSDNITRTSAYLSSERSNLRALSLAITNGDLYGKSLSNRPFSSVKYSDGYRNRDDQTKATPISLRQPTLRAPSKPRQLVRLDFYKPNINYEQALYLAVNKALEKYPDAMFDLIAVQPITKNTAKTAIESTRARRNAEKVLRALTQMGLPLDRVDLSYTKKDNIKNNEVHLYVR